MSDGYNPHGGVRNLWLSRAPAVLIDGPAGTGKTMGVLEKDDLFARKYPGTRQLWVRKTRASMTESVLVTYEQKVLPAVNTIANGAARKQRHSYTYPNGSEIVIGGLDNPDRIMSTEYDRISVFEATEATEDDIEKLQTRLRNGKGPYHQIVMECNPSAPSHFLIQGAHAGKWIRFVSRHADNPMLWNGTEWTEAGRVYMSILGNLTGHRRARLLEGHWAAAEGLVYPDFDPSLHIIDEMPKGWENWPHYRSIDFGYTNPFVCQWWATDPDGRLYLYREIYLSNRIVSDHAEEIKALTKERISETVSDHDAEDRATLDRCSVATTPATKDVTPGIQAVASRLRKAGDGRPRIYFLRDAIVRRDPRLVDAKKPCSTVEEFDSYLWSKTKDGKPNKEEPAKIDDHGMDAMRYIVMKLDGRGSVSAGFVSHAEPAPKPAVGPEPDIRNVFEEKRKDPNWGFNGAGNGRYR